MHIKQLLAITALFAMAPAALAGPRYNLNQAHRNLIEAVQSTGTVVKVNPTTCYRGDGSKLYGWYWATNKELVICQSNSDVSNLNTVIDFTAEDLDTLRHESQHLIQDCMDGTLQGSLDTVYKTPLIMGKKVMGPDEVFRVIEAYKDLSVERQILEVEAFAVARMNDPDEQVSDIKKYCF